jgi:hypothetical protein
MPEEKKPAPAPAPATPATEPLRESNRSPGTKTLDEGWRIEPIAPRDSADRPPPKR